MPAVQMPHAVPAVLQLSASSTQQHTAAVKMNACLVLTVVDLMHTPIGASCSPYFKYALLQQTS